MTPKEGQSSKTTFSETSRRKFLKTGTVAAGSLLLGAAVSKSYVQAQDKKEKEKHE